jgi:niacin transporter
MNNTLTINLPVLKSYTKKAVLLQALLIAAAVALPAFCHMAGLNGAALLPMHWPILIAGLVYGYRAGAVAAAASLGISFMLSGMPPAFLLPVMAGEVFIYGFICGLCREKFNLNFFASLFIALLAGKAVYIALGYIFIDNFSPAVLSAGLTAVLAQIIVIPFLAKAWTKNLQ